MVGVLSSNMASFTGAGVVAPPAFDVALEGGAIEDVKGAKVLELSKKATLFDGVLSPSTLETIAGERSGNKNDGRLRNKPCTQAMHGNTTHFNQKHTIGIFAPKSAYKYNTLFGPHLLLALYLSA